MKAKQIIGVLGLIILIFTAFNCKKTAASNCANNFVLSTELQTELQEVNAAASVYAQNPTTENCNKYKSAFQNYLDEARKLEDCAQMAGQGAEFIQAINEAETNLAQLQC